MVNDSISYINAHRAPQRALDCRPGLDPTKGILFNEATIVFVASRHVHSNKCV